MQKLVILLSNMYVFVNKKLEKTTFGKPAQVVTKLGSQVPTLCNLANNIGTSRYEQTNADKGKRCTRKVKEW